MNRSSKRADESADVSLPSGRLWRAVGAGQSRGPGSAKQLRPRWGLRPAKRFAKQNGRMLVAPVVSGGHLSRARSARERPARTAFPSPHNTTTLRIYQPPQPRPTNPQPSCPGEPANLPHPPKSRLTFHIQRKSRGKPFYINSKPCASNVQKNGPKTRPGRPG